MTTKTTIILSPIKRCYTSPNLKKRRITSMLTNRKSSPRIIKINYEKQNSSLNNLPDIVNDVFIEQQRRETITNIAAMLRKVGDQIDEQLQIDNTLSSSSDHIFGQRTMIFIHCLSHVLHFFL